MAELVAGAPAPTFTLVDLNNETVSLPALRGKPVILNFFHSGCAWCRTELPKLAEIYARHEDKTPVAIVGIAVGDDTMESARQFASDQNLDFPIVVDADRTLRGAYGLERVPTVIFVDESGLVQRIYEGSSEQLGGIVEQALLSSARGDELPDFALVGNGCAP
jgi:cytochrome c biogenesis protein CcmG/thiol:disulfide interchange protein DsbE